MFLGYDYRVWIAIVGAIIVKIITSEKHSFKRAAIVVSVSVFVAWIGTDFVIAKMGWDPDEDKIVTAALLALTGESIIRWFSNLDINELIKSWRGK